MCPWFPADRTLFALVAVPALALFGCRLDMYDQAHREPLEATTFFGDNRSAREPIEGTVPRGEILGEPEFTQGMDAAGELVSEFPIPVDMDLLRRGRERFNIFCAPCHSRTGDGDGMIVRRGYRKPPSYHIDRLLDAKVGYFFDVITRGFGVMPSYASQVPVRDRWAIVAYIRALQESRAASWGDVPFEERQKIERGGVQ